MKSGYFLIIIGIAITILCFGPPVQAGQNAPDSPDQLVLVAQYAKVIIYGVEGCSHTLAARKDHPGHIFYDVRKDPKRMKELEALTGGKRLWPVLVKGDQVTIGYGGS